MSIERCECGKMYFAGASPLCWECTIADEKPEWNLRKDNKMERTWNEHQDKNLTPDWLRGLYQDRDATLRRQINGIIQKKAREWSCNPQEKWREAYALFTQRTGIDLTGVAKKLDYIQDLGRLADLYDCV